MLTEAKYILFLSVALRGGTGLVGDFNARQAEMDFMPTV